MLTSDPLHELQAQQQAPTTANTFQQALSQAGLPFNQAIGQQAAQFAAALAQAQQASQLLPQQFNPAQLPAQFPAAQVGTHAAEGTSSDKATAGLYSQSFFGSPEVKLICKSWTFVRLQVPVALSL